MGIKHNNMKVLVVISALIAGICADADALYGAYGAYGGAALGYPYAYARGYARPAVAAAHVVAAPAVAAVRTVAAPAPVVAEVRAAVPTVTSTQFHSQDEEKNFAF